MLFKISKDDFGSIAYYIGKLSKISAFIFLIPILFVFIYKEPLVHINAYLVSALISALFGSLLYNKYYSKKRLSISQAVVITAIFWIIFNILAAMPFSFIEGMPFIDSFFESISATTTTGLTMIAKPDSIAKSLIFWRSLISWIGGLGVIILALLGVFSNIRNIALLSEAEGHSNFRSNIRHTITGYWKIYSILTLISIIALKIAGMPIFDAINYAMSAISTTGVESTNEGLLNANLAILIIVALTMIAGAISFITHSLAIKKRSIKEYFKDKEAISLFAIIIFGTALIFFKMKNFSLVLLKKIGFDLISAITCGGFAINSYKELLLLSDTTKIVFIASMIIGGASASTAGGIKISRFLLFLKSIYWSIKKSVLPVKTYFKKTFLKKEIKNEEIRKNNNFILLFVFFIFLSSFIMTFYGYTFINSLFEVSSAQSNVGISIGITNTEMPSSLKLLLIFNMYVGRLEIIPLFALLGFIFKIKR